MFKSCGLHKKYVASAWLINKFAFPNFLLPSLDLSISQSIMVCTSLTRSKIPIFEEHHKNV